MSELIIKKITEKKDFITFVKFPFKLYKGNKYWVPPIIADELEDFNPKKNPAYEYAESRHWLAYKNGEVVGRVAAIKHGFEFNEHKKIRFGWIDFVDDLEVSEALLNAVESWAKELKASELIGPMGFNDFDFQGMLVEGFNSITTIATIYNFPYYKDHLEKHGYSKELDWLELRHQFTEEVPKKLSRVANQISERFKFQVIPVHSKKDIQNNMDEFFEVVNTSYEGLFGFYKLTPAESRRIGKKYFSFLSRKYVKLIQNEEGKMIAFGISMPSLSQAFRKANGRLFPFGFIHLLKALKFNKSIDLYLVGVLPEYQKTGVIGMVYHELWKSFIKEGVTSFQANPALEDNARVFNLWKTLAGNSEVLDEKILKRRRCYSKKLTSNA